MAISSTGVLHRVIERTYPKPDFQQHAGDTRCGCIVDNGGNWSWDIAGEISPPPDVKRRCLFCWIEEIDR